MCYITITPSRDKVLVQRIYHQESWYQPKLFRDIQRRYDGCVCIAHRLAWWRHQMETFSALLANCAGNSPVSGEFPAQRPVTRSFDVFFDLRPNKRLSKHWWGWWFETPPWSLWRQCNGTCQHLWMWRGTTRLQCLITAYFRQGHPANTWAWLHQHRRCHEALSANRQPSLCFCSKWGVSPVIGTLLTDNLLLLCLETSPPVAWIRNYIHYKAWYENYLSIPKLQRLHRWSLGMDK